MYSYSYINETIRKMEEQVKTDERVVLTFASAWEVINMLKQLEDRAKDADHWEEQLIDLGYLGYRNGL